MSVVIKLTESNDGVRTTRVRTNPGHPGKSGAGGNPTRGSMYVRYTPHAHNDHMSICAEFFFQRNTPQLYARKTPSQSCVLQSVAEICGMLPVHRIQCERALSVKIAQSGMVAS